MTSQGAEFTELGINKQFKMATNSGTLSFFAIASLFSGNENFIKRGENAVRSGHVVEFSFDAEVGRLCGRVEASMKNTTYIVEVSQFILQLHNVFPIICNVQ